MKKKNEPNNIYIDPKGRAILNIPARDRDDLELKNGDTFKSKVDVESRKLTIYFDTEEKT
jgi:S-adenosylmethionine hydrolase